jgi:hypothetical protein
MAELTRNLARVAHVPGVLRRRALMVGCGDRATQQLLHATTQHAAVVGDASVLLHDFAALSDAWSTVEPSFESLAAALQRVSYSVLLKTSLADQADVLVTAAAMGARELLRLLLEARDVPWDATTIDFATLMELAAVNGHCALVTWLWSLPTNDELRVYRMPILRRKDLIRDALAKGAKRAYEALAEKHDGSEMGMLNQLQTLLGASCGPLMNLVEHDRSPSAMAASAEPATTADRITVMLLDQPSSVEVRVLTSRSLMSVVGAFQASPLAVVAPLMEQLAPLQRSSCAPSIKMAAVRLAIISGDLYTFKAASLVARVRPVDLPLLLHFAACEGRLDLVQWIHSQFEPSTRVRADTMSMAVRCGWPEIVEWLHHHCPESAQSMSECALNDAARWGHVAVLRVCHQYNLGKCITGGDLLARAIGAGQLEVVKLLHSLQWGYDRSVALTEAFKHGHLSIVRWLYGEEAVATGRLVEALCSNASTTDATVQYLWSLIDPSSDLVTRCVVDNFADICAKGATATVATVLPLVAPDSATAYEGLLAATRAKCQETAELLLRHWQPQEPHRIEALLKVALDTEHVPLMTWLIKSDEIASSSLDSLFTYAADKHTARLRAILSSCGGTYEPLKNVDVVDFAFAAMKEIHARQRREAVVQEPSVQSGAVVERALLAAVPACARHKLVTYLIRHGRALEQGDAEFSCTVTLANGIVVLKEEGEEGEEDQEEIEGQLVVRFARSLPDGPVAPFCGVHAARTGNLAVLKFLHDQQLLTPFVVEAITTVAHAHDQLTVIQWLVSLGESIANKEGIILAMAHGHKAIVEYLIDLSDDRVDGAIESVLLDELKADVEHVESERRQNKRKRWHSQALGWAMTLLQLLVQRRPTHHEKLLAIAAESGSMAAVQLMLGAQTTLDWASLDLPSTLIAAARSQSETVVKVIYERKTEATELPDIASLRRAGGLASVGAVETLLTWLSKWDPRVRGQLETEQRHARAIFPLRTTRLEPPRRCPRTIRQSQPRTRRLAHKQSICAV